MSTQFEQERQAPPFPPVIGVKEFDETIEKNPNLIHDFAGVHGASYQKILHDTVDRKLMISPYGEPRGINIDTVGTVLNFRGRDFSTPDDQILKENRIHGFYWAAAEVLIDMGIASSYQESDEILFDSSCDRYLSYLGNTDKQNLSDKTKLYLLTERERFINKILGSKEKHNLFLDKLKENKGVQIVLGKPAKFINWLKTVECEAADDYAIKISESIPSEFISMIVALGKNDELQLKRAFRI